MKKRILDLIMMLMLISIEILCWNQKGKKKTSVNRVDENKVFF